jgi:hypothetical protein
MSEGNRGTPFMLFIDFACANERGESVDFNRRSGEKVLIGPAPSGALEERSLEAGREQRHRFVANGVGDAHVSRSLGVYGFMFPVVPN